MKTSATELQSSASKPSRILQNLREATRAQHENIDRSMPILAADFTRQDYERLLERFFGFYATLEPVLLNHEELKRSGFDFSTRQKLPALRCDLLALGRIEAELDVLPHIPRVPNLANLPACLGLLYVIEGSTLGGQVISKQIAEKFQFGPQNGAAFFNSYGLNVGKQWQAFRGFLETHVFGAVEQREACQAAVETFECLEVWLAG